MEEFNNALKELLVVLHAHDEYMSQVIKKLDDTFIQLKDYIHEEPAH